MQRVKKMFDAVKNYIRPATDGREDAVIATLDRGAARVERARTRLEDTIKGMLEENDRLTKRLRSDETNSAHR